MSTNRRRVLVPRTMGGQGVALLRDRGDIETVEYSVPITQAQLLALLDECSGIALGVTPFGKDELAAAPALQVVARIGVGYDAVDVAALNGRRVPLMVSGTANSVSVAEQAFHLMIALAKRHGGLDRAVREGRWRERIDGLPMELAGKTVLIVGFGRIGTRLAKRCLAFDTNVLVFDPYADAAAIRGAGCEPAAELDRALPRADFVSIHCPKTPETVALFNEARFARMKRSAIIVNTARGGIIDETALHAALTSGQIAAAGLDVFEQEPTSADNPLLKLDNVSTSPHMAGVTSEAVAGMAVVTAQNILSVLDGRPNRDNVINKEVLD